MTETHAHRTCVEDMCTAHMPGARGHTHVNRLGLDLGHILGAHVAQILTPSQPLNRVPHDWQRQRSTAIPRSLEDPISLEDSISADDDGLRKCADEPHARSPLSERALAPTRVDVGGSKRSTPLSVAVTCKQSEEAGAGESGVGAIRPPRRWPAQRTEQPSERPCLSSVRLHYSPAPSSASSAKRQKRAPPTRSTVRSLMELASSLPPMTAMPVQSACPMHAPSVTPTGSRAAACSRVHTQKPGRAEARRCRES